MSAENFFKDKSGAEPQRRVIQADQPVDVIGGAAVVPGAGVKLTEKGTGEIFAKEDTTGIHTSSEYQVPAFQESADGGEKACHPVDGKHPDGSVSRQCVVFAVEGVQAGEKDLHAPAGRPAGQKIMSHIFKYGLER